MQGSDERSGEADGAPPREVSEWELYGHGRTDDLAAADSKEEGWGRFLFRIALLLAAASALVLIATRDTGEGVDARRQFANDCTTRSSADVCETVDDEYHDMCYSSANGKSLFAKLPTRNQVRRPPFDPADYFDCMNDQRLILEGIAKEGTPSH